MEQIILVSPKVKDFLKRLIGILHQEGYFNFEESAHRYVDTLQNAIHKDLPHLTHHSTPEELKKHGDYYVKIKARKRTTWYVFFYRSGNRYLIEFITNNHAPQSAYLNKL